MANELTMSYAIAYSDANGLQDEMGATGVQRSLTYPTMNRSPGLLVSHTVDTPVPLGGVAGPVLLAIENLDATNSVNVLTGLAGTVIATVPLGQFAVIPLPATITTPYLRALVADVRVDAMVA